jgi:DNA-directed RNA polymerase subunit F
MDGSPRREKTVAEMLSRVLVEIVDNNAHLMTILDVQARLLARLEARDVDEVVDEISELLKARRRAALREIDAWAQGDSTLFLDE